MEMLRESGTDVPYIGPVMDSVLSGRLHAGKVRKKNGKTDISFRTYRRTPFLELLPRAYTRDTRA